jgi:Crinkler effector protein N-terminal domain
MYTFNCIVLGDPLSNCFSIELDPTKSVYSSKKIISKEIGFRDAYKLAVYKLSNPIQLDSNDTESRLGVMTVESPEIVLLNPGKLVKYFDMEPKDDTLSILVVLPGKCNCDCKVITQY